MKALRQVTVSVLFVLMTGLLCAGTPLDAATGSNGGPLGDRGGYSQWCGTTPSNLAVNAARHAHFQRYLERERRAGRLPLVKSHDTIRQEGETAVIEDDGTLFIEPKPFDLQGKSMQYLRRPKGVSAVRSHLDFKATLGDKLQMGDDDSVLVEFPAGFEYPFGEGVYTSAWVNSDGSLTFDGPDTDISTRSLIRFLDRGPRIAPLFTDLDPSSATGEGGIYLHFLPGRVRVTWFQVPEFGTSNRNTVQVTLFETGRVTFVYGDEVQVPDSIVGVNPFGGAEPLHLMDYNVELPFRPQRVAIAEFFPDANPQIDEFSIPIRFFGHFRDVYDEVMIFYAYSRNLGLNVLGQSLTVNNEIRGIGVDVFDQSEFLGSRGRLHSMVELAGNVLEDYPDDPEARVANNGLTTMGLMSHEAGHRWLARLSFRDPDDGDVSTQLLGRQQAHWSFFMDSDGSALEGNDIVDNGDGTFLTLGPVEYRYSALDQYVMGLIPASAVPPWFYVANGAAGQWDRGSNSRAGVTITGTRKNVTVDDVIAVEGARIPSSAEAPKTFRIAFILVGAPGEEVPQEAIDKVERFRQRFETYFAEATDGNGQVLTTLLPR